MTGVTNVTSEVAFDALQTHFIERLDAPKCKQVLKNVWQNICICKAANEIVTQGDKKRLEDIYMDIFSKYKKWVRLLIHDGSMITTSVPAYVTEDMFLNADVHRRKKYSETKSPGMSMWKK